ncbi:hypothetical protein [Rhizobium sp. WYJ-E13]|uniref:hypothetical protein n=1 Tax=Rhizobium sp. WYJ-E13 TaxID=2849093 RepID=UPI001C1E92C5|nr:hypothetical protein [Rhizobium sp. WYJ-E13]QWW69030.1 hypothetical protein KQ933_04795 [Rhizobium sp. WYJ-E13]
MEQNSLAFEGFGIKATALGTLPVAGLLALLTIYLVTLTILRHREVSQRPRRTKLPK